MGILRLGGQNLANGLMHPQYGNIIQPVTMASIKRLENYFVWFKHVKTCLEK